MSLSHPLRTPWIAGPRGRLPKYENQVWEDEPRNHYCPDCRGVLTKVEKYFDLDTGLWTRYRVCMHCGVKHWEQPKTID